MVCKTSLSIPKTFRGIGRKNRMDINIYSIAIAIVTKMIDVNKVNDSGVMCQIY